MEKHRQYKTLLSQAKGLIDSNMDDIANMANLTALIHQTFKHHWIGFYRVTKDTLTLGPFQGPVACTRIKKGQGVCGATWEKEQTIIVENVDEFPGHIACSSLSKSEIVVPAFKNNEVALILDLDSNKLADFDQIDQHYLEEIVQLIEEVI